MDFLWPWTLVYLEMLCPHGRMLCVLWFAGGPGKVEKPVSAGGQATEKA